VAEKCGSAMVNHFISMIFVSLKVLDKFITCWGLNIQISITLSNKLFQEIELKIIMAVKTLLGIPYQNPSSLHEDGTFLC
jgi:hypothetical protein